MDQPTSGPADRTRIWSAIPPGACQPSTQAAGLDAAEAHGASQTAQAGRDRALVARPLAPAQKKIRQERRTLVFIDESGFYLLPMVVRSYAPRGLTPILHEYLSRDHLAVMGAVTPRGQLFLKSYFQAITSEQVIDFLDELQRQLQGRLLVLWDSSPTHVSKRLRGYLSNGAARRIQIERFPGYAPELNPTEWVWSYFKLGPLANVACEVLPQLNQLLRNAKQRLQRHPALIRAFIHHVGYQV
jgi:DDE superfamily endonuclease